MKAAGSVWLMIAVFASAGCSTVPAEEPADPTRPRITLDCVKHPLPTRDRAFERCVLVSVEPDTVATRDLAERYLSNLPIARSRSPSEDLIGAQTIRVSVRLTPQASAVGDAAGEPR